MVGVEARGERRSLTFRHRASFRRRFSAGLGTAPGADQPAPRADLRRIRDTLASMDELRDGEDADRRLLELRTLRAYIHASRLLESVSAALDPRKRKRQLADHRLGGKKPHCR